MHRFRQRRGGYHTHPLTRKLNKKVRSKLREDTTGNEIEKYSREKKCQSKDASVTFFSFFIHTSKNQAHYDTQTINYLFTTQ